MYMLCKGSIMSDLSDINPFYFFPSLDERLSTNSNSILKLSIFILKQFCLKKKHLSINTPYFIVSSDADSSNCIKASEIIGCFLLRTTRMHVHVYTRIHK